MGFVTPAQSGRALNFGRPNPSPVWTKAGTEYPFPNALGWYQIFQVDAIVVAITPNYGVPFIDLQSPMRTAIGLSSRFKTEIGARAVLKVGIDLVSKLPSSRISRSTKDG